MDAENGNGPETSNLEAPTGSSSTQTMQELDETVLAAGGGARITDLDRYLFGSCTFCSYLCQKTNLLS